MTTLAEELGGAKRGLQTVPNSKIVEIIKALGGPVVDWFSTGVKGGIIEPTASLLSQAKESSAPYLEQAGQIAGPYLEPTVKGLKQMVTDPLSHPQLGPILSSEASPYGLTQAALEAIVQNLTSPQATVEETPAPTVPPPVIDWQGGQETSAPAPASWLEKELPILARGKIGVAPKDTTKAYKKQDQSWWGQNKDKILAGLAGMAQGAAQPLPVGGGSTGLLLARTGAGLSEGLAKQEAKETESKRYEDLLGFKTEELEIERTKLDIDAIRANASMIAALAQGDAAKARLEKEKNKDERKKVGAYRVPVDPDATPQEKVAAEAATRVINGAPNKFRLRLEAEARKQAQEVRALAFMAMDSTMSREEAMQAAAAQMINEKEGTQDEINNRMALLVKGLLASDFSSLTPEQQQDYLALLRLGGATVK